jgi:predicted anti-sigma-YlaC factor YlaD
MDCDMVRELLETRAVEALDARQARAVDEHLASCVDCERLYDTYRQIAASMPEAVVDAAPYRAPESLRERVLSATRGERRDPHFKRAISVVFRPQVAAAVLSVIFLGISVAWGLHQTAALARERSLRSELSGAIGQQELIFEVVDSPRTVKAFLRVRLLTESSIRAPTCLTWSR